ncbi:MAG: DNA polymerase III subunit gamma/tau [Desulfovibrio sp.]
MSRLSLASRYRPQLFAEVGGQELVTSALSRAAANDNPAAAYLLSGTRGVGKTTIARIFAKALNCERGPAAEPCNECPQCLKVTKGSHVDVCEIDGASNNRVEDARSLRETIGYAPMEGRYRVFIIDEAHMLSNSAFNALLKTLEEPPSRVVFIFATTEAHKFPITIVSRCQHFVFSHLSEDALAIHLGKILKLENIAYEDAALRILARRAAGSVRDSLSLLDQVLALGGEKLTATDTRAILGLAGLDLFETLFHSLARGDIAAIISVCRQILSRGLDIGYFIRDLSASLRNLFLLSQGGENMAGVLGLSANEKKFLLGHATEFSPAHLHAAWQLALSSQREVIQNPEPGAALEMLLLNMTLLPKLLPVENVAELGIPLKNNPPSGVPKVAETQNFAKAEAAQVDDRPTSKPDHPELAAGNKAEPAKVEEDIKNDDCIPGKKGIAATEPPTWQGFREFCHVRQEQGLAVPTTRILSGLYGLWQEGRVILKASHVTAHEAAKKELSLLREVMADYCGDVEVEISGPDEVRTEREIMTELENNPELKSCMEILNAQITHCREIK